MYINITLQWNFNFELYSDLYIRFHIDPTLRLIVCTMRECLYEHLSQSETMREKIASS